MSNHSQVSGFDPEPIINALSEQGYAVVDNAIARALEECQAAYTQVQSHHLKRAGVGPGNAQQLDDVRRDKIFWLQEPSVTLPKYSQAMELLRNAVNQAFYLGLFDFECHFARYDAGDFYQKHWDAFRGKSNRRLSTIYYLNDDWAASDGGELLIYDQEDANKVVQSVAPYGGRLVVFFSELFAHEVLPAKTSRNSLTGWFRVRNS